MVAEKSYSEEDVQKRYGMEKPLEYMRIEEKLMDIVERVKKTRWAYPKGAYLFVSKMPN